MTSKNVVVAQSGGATPVINSSLRGVIEGCRSYPSKFGRILAGFHGIEGILKEELIDLTEIPEEEVKLLSSTPGAGFIGTCRYKIREGFDEDLARIVDVFKAHDVGYFFYIGGNDSMHTAFRVAELAHQKGLDLVAIGVPKTIDNDLGDQEMKLVDHTPGYGSAARFWALNILTANEENKGACTSDPVLVLQAMGRRIGFIPAAARLADPHRELPLVILLAEVNMPLEEIADRINDVVRRHSRAIVVISEGYNLGELGGTKDAFGHMQFSTAATTAAQLLVTYLNKIGLPARGKARADIAGTYQRRDIITASPVDIQEAYNVALHAVKLAAEGEAGVMATIRRVSNSPYTVSFGQIPLDVVALAERKFPTEWIAENKIDVTDEFIKYAMPLIGESPFVPSFAGGLYRFARIEGKFVDKKLPAYTPQGWRTGG